MQQPGIPWRFYLFVLLGLPTIIWVAFWITPFDQGLARADAVFILVILALVILLGLLGRVLQSWHIIETFPKPSALERRQQQMRAYAIVGLVLACAELWLKHCL